MAKMSFEQGSISIEKMLNKHPNNKVRQGVIDQILWCVAYGDGITFANALIWKYELYLFSKGSHNWFECDETSGPTIINRYPRWITSLEDLKFPTKRQVKNVEKLAEMN